MTKHELKILIKEDKQYYFGNFCKRIKRFLTHNPLYQRGKYIIICRKVGFYFLNNDSLKGKIMHAFYTRKKNILGEKLNIELGPNTFGKRIKIYHNNIVINAGTLLGDDCEFYGNNCIGNKGSDFEPLGAPLVGNNVSFGFGANAIGKIKICSNVQISSMSLINKDIKESGVYGGTPVKLLKNTVNIKTIK